MARIYGHSYRVEQTLAKLGEKRLKQTPYMGVEHELEFSNNLRIGDIEKVTDRIVELLGSDFVMCKRDGSLKNHGEGGVEIVTAPALLPIQQERWTRFYENVPEELEATGRCGLHIHLDRSVIPKTVVGKVCYFLYHHENSNRGFLESLAGRKCDEYGEIYQIDMSRRWKTFEAQSYGKDWTEDRYGALNISGDRTIEFRLFGASLLKERFMRRLEFASAIVRWARTLSADPSDGSWTRKNFVDWISDQSKRYPFLTAWLGERKQFRTHKDGWDENGSIRDDDGYYIDDEDIY